MKRLNSTELKALKESVLITDVAKALGVEVIKGKARCWNGQNHAHGDRTPSVSFTPDKGSFRCWVCSELRGDVFNLIQSVQECNFGEAVEWLQGFANVPQMTHSSLEFGLKKIPQKFKPEAPILHTEHLEPVLSVEKRFAMLADFYALLDPIQGEVQRYLKKRKIFQKTWLKLGLRCVGDYQKLNQTLAQKYPMSELQALGLYNQSENLRFFKHPLLFPYFNSKGKVGYFQARAVEDLEPRFLNLAGKVPFPYNARILDKSAGVVFLCESVTDVMTMVEKGFPAVGIAGVSSFKEKWVQLFENKKVFLAFDGDKAGREGAQQVKQILEKGAIKTEIMEIPDGLDVNEWFSR